MRSLLTSAAVTLSLAMAPLAQAAGPSRSSAPMEAESEIGGGSLPISVLIVLATVIGGAIYLLADDDDNPDSP